jgi:hypothetical protein
VLQSGTTGIEIVVWSTIAAAAILPTIFLEWPATKAKPSPKVLAQAS